MLFCISMDATLLGLLLAACICLGMATTISLVVIIIVLGKTGILSPLSQPHMMRVEGVVGLVPGIAITLFGGLFFLAAVNVA